MPILIFGSGGATVVSAPYELPVGSVSSMAPVPRQRVFTNLGAIAPGALLHTYVAGTPATPLPTYHDKALLIPNANPVEASASGLFGPIFLINGQAYHLVLTEADGTPIWDQDNVGEDLDVPTVVTAAIADAMAAVAAGTIPVTQAYASVGPQNDIALTPAVSYLRLTNTSLLTISGFSAGIHGQRLTVVSDGAGQVDFLNESGLSLAANRFRNAATSGPTSLAAGSGTAVFSYDGTIARWRLVTHEQGAWITPTFAAGNFTGSGGWTVDAGDLVTMAYWLRGRTLTVAWYMGSTTVVSGTDLRIGNGAYGGYTTGKTTLNPVGFNDGAGNQVGIAQATATSPTFLLLLKQAGASWTAGTNAVSLYGEITFEVA